MCEQLTLDIDYQSDSYKSAEKEYGECLPLKYFEPVFLCFSFVTKEYFVSKIFKRETIETKFTKIKIIK